MLILDTKTGKMPQLVYLRLETGDVSFSADQNTASSKVIEKFGAQLENVIDDPTTGDRVRRYWLSVDLN